jgi:hypothetical protein
MVLRRGPHIKGIKIMSLSVLKNYTYLAITAASLLAGFDTKAATVTSRFTENDGQAVIELSGEIVPGDSEHVENWIKYWNNKGVRVSGIRLDSRGGNVIEASNIAVLIRRANMASVVGRNKECLSACVLVFAYGTEKWVNTTSEIGVHSVSENGKESLIADAITAVFVRDLKSVGAPDSVIVKTITTPSDEISYLSANEVRAMGGKII